MTKASDDTVSTDPRAHAEAAGYQSGKLPMEAPKFNPMAVIREEYERLAAPETRLRCPFEKCLELLMRTNKPYETGEIVASVLESEVRLWAGAFVHGMNTETYRQLSDESYKRLAHGHSSYVYAIRDRLKELEQGCVIDPFRCVLRKKPERESDGKSQLPQELLDILRYIIAGSK